MCPGRGKLDVWFLVVFLPDQHHSDKPQTKFFCVGTFRPEHSSTGEQIMTIQLDSTGLHESSALLLPTRHKKPQSSLAHLEADLILGLLGVLLDGVGGGHGGGVDVGVVGDDEPAAGGEGYKVLVRIFTI